MFEQVDMPFFWALCTGCGKNKLFGRGPLARVGCVGWREKGTEQLYCDSCKREREAQTAHAA